MREKVYQEKSPIYLTIEELEELKKQAKEKERQLNEVSKSIGETTEQSSETWHDNAPFDAAIEATRLLDQQYKSLLDKIKNAIIIEKSKSKHDKIIFGTKVKILLNLKTEKTITISGISNIKEGKVSIGSPLGQAVIGKKEGEEGIFQVDKQINKVKILKILE